MENSTLIPGAIHPEPAIFCTEYKKDFMTGGTLAIYRQGRESVVRSKHPKTSYATK